MNKKEYLAKRNALLNEAQELLNTGKVDEFTAKENEIKALDAQFEAVGKAQANMNALKDIKVVDDKIENLLNPNNEIGKIEVEDRFNTKEYRKAFMDFCKTGVMSKEFSNIDTYTSTTEAAALIPTTIMSELLSKMESYGQVFGRVRMLNVKGGINFPILSLKPTATWVTEGTPSDRKKITSNTSLSFSYFGLECKVATSLLAETVTLPMFESTIVGLIAGAMTKALEVAIIKGAGTTEPLGIVNDTRVPAAQIITLTSAEFVDWGSWKKKIFGKIPLAYRAGGSFLMASQTFEGYIDGMQDANGQPMARVNYGIVDAPQERFGGKEVMLVEDDVIAPYDTAAVGDVVGIFCKLSDYGINSNMQMSMYRWLDHDINQWVDKAILIADGKLIDPNGVIIIKKGA